METAQEQAETKLMAKLYSAWDRSLDIWLPKDVWLPKGWHLHRRVTFWVAHAPISQPRPRVRITNSNRVYAYTPSKHPVHEFKHHVVRSFLDEVQGKSAQEEQTPSWQVPTDPVSMWVDCYFERPVSEHRRRKIPTREPYSRARNDWDNVGKAIADALTGYAWHNDGQLWSVTVNRYLAGQEEMPGCWIMLCWYSR